MSNPGSRGSNNFKYPQIVKDINVRGLNEHLHHVKWSFRDSKLQTLVQLSLTLYQVKHEMQ